MANIKISDLPPIALPAVGDETFFEVQTVAAGEDVSRKISLDEIVSTTGLDASFVTVDANVQLPNERVLTAGAGIDIVDGGPNSTITISSTIAFPLLAPDGTVAAPSYSWLSETNAGMYYDTQPKWAALGTEVMRMDDTGLLGPAGTSPTWYLVSDVPASATDPIYSFNNDNSSGIGQNASAQVSIIAGGVEGVRVTEVAAAITVDISGALNVSGLATFNGISQFNAAATFSDDVAIRDGADFEIFDATNTVRVLLTTRVGPPDAFDISGAGDVEHFDVRGFNISMRLRDGISLSIEEITAAPADAAGFGQFWVRDDVPNVPMFTDDAGTDFELNAGGNVFNVGLPLDNQIAVWTGEFTIEGDPRFIWTGSRFEIFGAGLSNRMRMEHDDTDFNMTAINGGAFNINGLGDGIDIESNASSPAGNLFFKVHGDADFVSDFVTARFVNDNATDVGATRIEIFGNREVTPGAVQIFHTGANHVAAAIVGGPSGTSGGIGTVGTDTPFSLFTDTIERVRIESSGLSVRQPIYITEQAAANADVAGEGQFWVRSDTPNVAMFTNDVGTDFVLGGAPATPDLEAVTTVGNVTDNGIVFTSPIVDAQLSIDVDNGGPVNIVADTDVEVIAGATMLFKVDAAGSMSFNIGNDNAMTIQDEIVRVNTNSGGFFEIRDDIGSNLRINMTSFGPSFIAAAIVGGDPVSYFFQPVSGGEGMSFKIAEMTAAPSDSAGFGQLWVRDDTPNNLIFTDDAGTDFVLNAGGVPTVDRLTVGGFDKLIAVTSSQLEARGNIIGSSPAVDTDNGTNSWAMTNSDDTVVWGAMDWGSGAFGGFTSNVRGQNVRWRATKALGGLATVFTADPDAGASLVYNGGTRFSTIDEGIRVERTALPGASIFIHERATAAADVPADGQFWVRDDVPNVPMFTDDAGTDFELNASAPVDSVFGRVGAVVALQADYDAFYLVKAAFAAQTVLSDVQFDGKITFTDITGVQFDPSVEIDMRNPADDTTFFMQYVAAGVAWGLAGTDFNSVFMDFGSSFTHFRFGDPILMTERAAAVADVAGLGQFWVRNDVPNTPMFTDDVGTDFVLNAAAAVPGGADTAVQFNNAGAFGGSPDFEWDGSELKVEASQAGIIADESDGGGASFLRATSTSTGDSGIQLEFNSTTGINAVLRQVTPGGALEDVWISFAENAGVGIRHNDIQKLLTVASGVQFDDSLYVIEKAAANADIATQGQFWVRNDVPNTPMFTDDAGTDFELNAAGAVANDAVQARRTTDYLLTVAFVDITLDTTDVETDAAVLDHDLVTNTDNIIIGVTGTYEITVDVTADPTGAPNRRMVMNARVRLNDLGTGIAGSIVHTNYTRDATAVFDNHLSFSFIANLTATDFITLQLSKTLIGGALGTDNANELTMKAVRLL